MCFFTRLAEAYLEGHVSIVTNHHSFIPVSAKEMDDSRYSRSEMGFNVEPHALTCQQHPYTFVYDQFGGPNQLLFFRIGGVPGVRNFRTPQILILGFHFLRPQEARGNSRIIIECVLYLHACIFYFSVKYTRPLLIDRRPGLIFLGHYE